MITAQDAVDDLYRIAVTEDKATSTSRLDVLADFCVQELTRRGLKDVEKEASIPGAGREKRWDIAWQYDRKYESPQTRVGRGGASSMPPQQRNSIEMSAPWEWNP